MSIALQLPRQHPSARPSILLCVVLSAALVAACGTSTTSVPSGSIATIATPNPTAGPTGSGAATSASPGALPSSSAGEASSSASAVGGVDACTLGTSAEVADIVGGAVKGAEMLVSGWVASGCAWSGATTSFIISVGTASSFLSFRDPAALDAKARLTQYKQQANGRDVTGFGAGAVLTSIGMAAYKGDTYVEVERLRLTDAQLQKIMTLLLSRL